MEWLKLIGVVIVVVGFALKFDTILVVVVAGLATGLVSGMSFMDILNTMGGAFTSQRLATLFVLTLPVIGICERYGLKQKAVDFIAKIKHATTGKVMSVYLLLRAVMAALSIRLSGHPQFVRPLINPMAQGAAIAKYGKIDEKTEDTIKGYCAASENFGNFFAQNVFMGSSGCLLVVSVLAEQGYNVNVMNVALWSIPAAVAAVIIGTISNLRLDKKLDRKYAAKAAVEGDSGKEVK